MRSVEAVFVAGWTAFWIYWLIAAFSVKKGHVLRSRKLGVRLVVATIAVLLVRFGVLRDHDLHTEPWRAGCGLVLFVLGLAVALWARVNLGANWGTPMTEKNEPDLVTTGPYRLVRHPIYAGILVAAVGTAVALNRSWLIAVALVGIYFGYSAAVEERFLAEQFPHRYPQYRRSTKRLVPFIY